MSIVLTKTIRQKGLGYSIGAGTTATASIVITLSGMEEASIGSKKDVQPKPIPQDWQSSTDDKITFYFIDLKKVDEQISLRGWLEDTPVNDSSITVGGTPETNAVTAWEKFFVLRSMQTSGGRLTSLQLGGITFNASTVSDIYYPGVTLVECNAIIPANDTGDIQTAYDSSGEIARLQVTLVFLLGDDVQNQ